jgi:hypothetical protein
LRRARQRNPNAAAAETHEVEPPTKKREKRRLAISPLWVTVAICFAMLAVVVFALKSLSDTPASSSEPEQQAAPKKLLQSDATADKSKQEQNDNFTEGSTWNGAWVALTPGRVAGPVTLTITDRTGNNFNGIIFGDHERGFAHIAGSINGNRVEWRATKVLHSDRPELNGYISKGTINGNFYCEDWKHDPNETGVTLLKRDVASDNSATAENPKRQSADNFAEGSTWTGAWVTLWPGSPHRSAGAGDFTLTVTQRVDKFFKGEVHTDHDRGFGYIMGTIEGNQINSISTKNVRADIPITEGDVAKYTIDGDFAYISFEHDSAGNSGMVLLRRDQPPLVDESLGIGKPSDSPVLFPDDAVELKGHHYRYFNAPLTWYACRATCELMGGHLICIDDAQKDAFAKDLIEKCHAEGAWIGLNKESKDDSWGWVNGKQLSYSGWAQGQPDNRNGIETCVQTWGTNPTQPSGWHDYYGGSLQGYICEWDR